MERNICATLLLILTGSLLFDFGDAQNEKQILLKRKGNAGDDIPKVPLGTTGKSRTRRMSCDALSFPLPYGYMNHVACATYCFVSGQNFRGHCEFGWCKCK